MPPLVIPADPPTDRDGLTELRVDTLGYLAEQYPQEVLRQKLALIQDDLEGRGHDGKVRTLTIRLAFRKKQGQVEVDVEVEERLPKVVTPPTRLKTNRDGRLAFRAENPDNPAQPTLPISPRVATAE